MVCVLCTLVSDAMGKCLDHKTEVVVESNIFTDHTTSVVVPACQLY